MKDVLAVVQELLPELAAYAQTTDQVDLAGFAAWLHRRTAPAAPTTPESFPHQEPAFLNRLSPLMQLGPLVARLQHFGQVRAQQLLADLEPITNQRDFVVLATIAHNETPTKSEIAGISLLELSMITEITRRLTQAHLVEEVPDPQDRRTRRLQITPAGRQLLQEAFKRMAQLGPYVYEPLTPEEQVELRRLLSLVNTAHTVALRKPS